MCSHAIETNDEEKYAICLFQLFGFYFILFYMCVFFILSNKNMKVVAYNDVINDVIRHRKRAIHRVPLLELKLKLNSRGPVCLVQLSVLKMWNAHDDIRMDDLWWLHPLMVSRISLYYVVVAAAAVATATVLLLCLFASRTHTAHKGMQSISKSVIHGFLESDERTPSLSSKRAITARRYKQLKRNEHHRCKTFCK